MIIYLCTAPEHDRSGYADALINGDHTHLLVPFPKYIEPKFRNIDGFSPSPKNQPTTKEDHD